MYATISRQTRQTGGYGEGNDGDDDDVIESVDDSLEKDPRDVTTKRSSHTASVTRKGRESKRLQCPDICVVNGRREGKNGKIK